MPSRTIENKVHVHDPVAATLHVLVMDHPKLTYRYQGRDFRLTGVQGEVMKALLSRIMVAPSSLRSLAESWSDQTG
jgi:hypothetical protein